MRYTLSLLMLLLLSLGGCEQPAQDTTDVSADLDSLQKRIVWLKYRSAQFEWRELTGQPVDSQQLYRRVWRDVTGDLTTLERLQRATAKLDDGNEHRRYQLLTSLLLKGVVESSDHIVALRDSLELARDSYRVDFRGGQQDIDGLSRTLQTADDRSVRERAWQAWAGLGSDMAGGIERLIRLRNQQSGRLRYNNFAALALDADSIEQSWFVALLDSLEAATEEPYLAAIEGRTAAVGRNQLQPWDLTWSAGDRLISLDQYFPIDSQISFLRSALSACGIDLDKQPIYWDVTAFENSPELIRACVVRPGQDQRIRANLRPGFSTQSELAHQAGIALQAAFVNQGEPLFAWLIDDAWRRCSGLIFEEIANRPEFLVNIAGVPPRVVQAYRQARFNQAVIDWRIMLAKARFEYEAYLDANRDLDELWWDICERVLGLPRHDQLSWWASEIDLISRPMASVDRLLAGLAAAQTLNFLRDHNPTLLDTQTKSFLVQHYFRYGSSADWRRLLSHATERELSHRALIDWFEAEAAEL